jgi:hypothetical protein
VADVLKLAEAKVDPEVIKAYVRTSPTPYNLSATEIIALKEHGISSDILTAMIQHGGELRSQLARTAQPAGNPPVQPPYADTGSAYAPAPAYDYSTQPVYSDYAYASPAYYPYSLGNAGCGFGGYYGGGGCGYSWPYCWPSAYWGAFPYRGYCGSRYPGWYGGRGYGYYGNRGYYGSRGYYGAGHYYGGHSAAYTGGGVGFHAAAGARSVSYGGHSGGFSGSAGGFSGHAGGSGGHAGGHGR